MIRIREEKFWELQGEQTDEAFSKKLGVSRTQLWRIKTGKASVGAGFLERFMGCYPELPLNDYFFISSDA